MHQPAPRPPAPAPPRRHPVMGVLLGANLDPGAAETLQRQLYNLFRHLILNGRLLPGSRLPSTRTVADELGIARNTAIAVFEQLQVEGYVTSRTGSGTQVSDQLPEALLQSIHQGPAQVGARSDLHISSRGRAVETVFEADPIWQPFFSPGMPSVAEFPFAAWSRMLATEWNNPGRGALSEGPGGYRPLQEAIAAYVGTARDIPCDPSQVIVTSGSREGTELATRVLLDSGETAIIEEPGYPGTRAALRASGILPIPLRVDQNGLVLAEAGPDHRAARMLLTAPSHQYPLGGTTALARRLELVAWGHRHGTWIVEDDYDSEFRFSGRPFPSLYSLDPGGIVIYTGTFAKTAFPSLRLGYLIVPRRLVQPFLRMKQATSGPVTLVTQRAMARFMESGAFFRHVRRMRTLYGQRRSVLRSAIAAHLPGLVIPPQEEAGLFLTTFFGPALAQTCQDTETTTALKQLGIHLEPLSPLYAGPAPRQGLIFGYGSLREAALARPLAIVARQLGRPAIAP